MGAKVFISWSGELSKSLGEALKDWIPKVIQTVKPYFTPDDIEKGARWAKEIGQELSSSQLGIICLTLENQHSPWILFEAGALSKNLEESKVCPLLFNFDTAELKGPLSAFQATRFTKEDVKKLLESINSSCDESKLDQKSLDETFEVWWPMLEKRINTILATDKDKPKATKRPDRDILEEILDLTRSNAKSLMSDGQRISRMTVAEILHLYRMLRDKVIAGQDVSKELFQLESALNRLCREGNFDELLVRRYLRFPYNGGLHRVTMSEKNSGSSKLYGPDEDGK